MRKLLSIMLVIMLVGSLFIGCAKKEEPVTEPTEATSAESTEATAENTEANADTQESGYADGIYFATEDNFNDQTGWKSTVTVTVEGGKITKVDWNAANKAAGKDKKTASADGDYGLVAKGGAQAEWHEQAAVVEQYLVDNQSVDGINLLDEEGHTDSITGVSIHVGDFAALVEKALAQGPVGKGPYTDGVHYAEASDFGSSGWKDNVTITVINGNILAVNWNGTSKDGGKDKKTASIDGDYGMKNGGAQSEWHEQAAAMEAYLLETQSPDQITMTAEGTTDAVTGVSIHVGDFVTLCQEALSK